MKATVSILTSDEDTRDLIDEPMGCQWDGRVRLDIGHLTPEPNVMFVGALIDFDLATANALYFVLGNAIKEGERQAKGSK